MTFHIQKQRKKGDNKKKVNNTDSDILNTGRKFVKKVTTVGKVKKMGSNVKPKFVEKTKTTKKF